MTEVNPQKASDEGQPISDPAELGTREGWEKKPNHADQGEACGHEHSLPWNLLAIVAIPQHGKNRRGGEVQGHVRCRGKLQGPDKCHDIDRKTEAGTQPQTSPKCLVDLNSRSQRWKKANGTEQNAATDEKSEASGPHWRPLGDHDFGGDVIATPKEDRDTNRRKDFPSRSDLRHAIVSSGFLREGNGNFD